MKSKTIKFRDPVVENVVDKFISRSDFGFEKYGQSMHNERITKQKDLAGYLNDIQEELMDAILYIQAAREELAEDDKENILGVNSPLPESFRPPHPSHADEFYHLADNKLVGGMTGDTEKGLVNAQKKWDSAAQQDWDDAISPV